jgi:hypothetical protein
MRSKYKTLETEFWETVGEEDLREISSDIITISTLLSRFPDNIKSKYTNQPPSTLPPGDKLSNYLPGSITNQPGGNFYGTATQLKSSGVIGGNSPIKYLTESNFNFRQEILQNSGVPIKYYIPGCVCLDTDNQCLNTIDPTQGWCGSKTFCNGYIADLQDQIAGKTITLDQYRSTAFCQAAFVTLYHPANEENSDIIYTYDEDTCVDQPVEYSSGYYFDDNKVAFEYNTQDCFYLQITFVTPKGKVHLSCSCGLSTCIGDGSIPSIFDAGSMELCYCPPKKIKPIFLDPNLKEGSTAYIFCDWSGNGMPDYYAYQALGQSDDNVLVKASFFPCKCTVVGVS